MNTVIRMQSALAASLKARPRQAQTPSVPAGDHLVAALARLGIATGEVAVLRRHLADLKGAHFPCVVVRQDGTGLALTGREGAELLAETVEGPCRIACDDLEPHYSGTLLARREGAEQAGEGAEGPMAQGKSLFRHILKLTLCDRLMPQLLLAACLGNIFMLALPVYSMAVYDRIIPHKAVETLWALTGGILVVLMVDLFSRIMRNRLQEAIGTRISLDLQNALMRHTLAADLLRASRKPGVLSSALGAIDGAALLCPALIAGLVVDLPFAVAMLAYVGFIGHWVVLAPLAALFAIVLSNVASHWTARRAHAASARALLERTALIEEGTQSLEILKSNTATAPLARRWFDLVDETLYHGHVGRRASTHAGLALGTILQVSTVLSLVAGVFMIGAGELTVGGLVAAVMLSGRALSPVGTLASTVMRALSLAEPLAHANRLRDVPRETRGDETRRAPKLNGSVRLAGVSFRYADEPRAALSQIELSIKPGEKVGFIGKIGSGKSTLLHLVPRLYTPESGSVLLDEHDVRQYDPVWLRSQVAYMPQDCDLFDTTIRDNIVRGLGQVDEESFRRAVIASGVQDIASAHPAGYGLTVGPHGRRLSGGERQAVCLARTLVRRAPIMVLDEPTSAMDSQLERRIVQRLRTVLDGATVLIATHRMPLLELVDRVVWLEGGRVIADGPKAEVLQRAAKLSA